ncbi:MAG TPA: MotA/TolQ/ExbB proton channel family protein [Longimicrobiales bacterium]|nr:MotA/TolQ/ExbB proton channel family protein [Longimicrobiales bacterium]
MSQAFTSGGFMMWPILICGALTLVIAATSGFRLTRAQPSELAEARSGMDAILFWGTLALVLGLLGSAVGVMRAARALELAGDVPAALVWEAVRLVLITTTFGLLVLTVSLLAWFGLWLGHRRAGQQRTA